MRRLRCTWAFLFLLIAFQPTFCQKTEGPNIEQTYAFLKTSLEAQGDQFFDLPLANGHCDVVVNRETRYGYLLPDPPSGWHVYVSYPEAAKFNLHEINPSSIHSTGILSTDYALAHKEDAYEKLLTSTDLYFVFFEARNGFNAIEVSTFKDQAKTPVTEVHFEEKRKGGSMIFTSKDRAERFVTAFKHAVDLCGGAPDDFPPTPSR